MSSLTFKIIKKFSENLQELSKDFVKKGEYNIEPLYDLMAKRFRKTYLDNPLLDKRKIIVPALKIRTFEDSLLKLKDNNLVAGYILARDEFPEIPLVFNSK